MTENAIAKEIVDAAFRIHIPVSSMGWKKSLSQSRKGAKNTDEAAGFGLLPV